MGIYVISNTVHPNAIYLHLKYSFYFLVKELKDFKG